MNELYDILDIVERFWDVYKKAPRLHDIHTRMMYPPKRKTFTLFVVSLLIAGRYLKIGPTGYEVNYNWPNKE
jgi:hypothetical protein